MANCTQRVTSAYSRLAKATTSFMRATAKVRAGNTSKAARASVKVARRKKDVAASRVASILLRCKS